MTFLFRLVSRKSRVYRKRVNVFRKDWRNTPFRGWTIAILSTLAQADAGRQSFDATVDSPRHETFGALGEAAGWSLTSRQLKWLPQFKRGQRLAIEMPNNRDRREFANATQSHRRLARGRKKRRGIDVAGEENGGEELEKID